MTHPKTEGHPNRAKKVLKTRRVPLSPKTEGHPNSAPLKCCAKCVPLSPKTEGHPNAGDGDIDVAWFRYPPKPRVIPTDVAEKP